MLVQLPNGKTREMSFEEWDRLNEADFQYMLATDQGDQIEDPFHSSVLKRPAVHEAIDAAPENIEETLDVPIEDKLIDIDYTHDEE
jgi:hypothetical protein